MNERQWKIFSQKMSNFLVQTQPDTKICDTDLKHSILIIAFELFERVYASNCVNLFGFFFVRLPFSMVLNNEMLFR